jgi:hypothetical protein
MSLDKDTLEALAKALAPLAGDDTAKQAHIVNVLSDLAKSGDGKDGKDGKDAEPDEDPDDVNKQAEPVADVMLGLLDAVSAINKSAEPNKGALISEAFEEAYDAIRKVNEEIAQAAIVAGQESITKSKAFKKMRKLAKRAKAGIADNTTGGGGTSGKTQQTRHDAAEMSADHSPDEMDDSEDEFGVKKAMKAKQIAKSLGGGPLAVFISDLAKSTERLGAEVAQLRDEKQTEVFKQRAAAIGEGPQVADLLKTLAKTDPKLADTVGNLLKSKNALIEKSGVFNSIGTGGGAEGSSSLEKLNAFATEIITKSTGDKKPTFAKAFLAACEQHPDVYKDYQREERGSR